MESPASNKGVYVSDLRPGDRVTGFFLVRQKQLEPFRDRSKGEFLTLVLSDRTGQVLARVWEDAPALAETFAVDDVVKVAGDVEEYLGRTQLIIQKLRPALPNEIELSDYVAATQRDTAAMLTQVQAAVDSLRDRHLAALVRHFYDEREFVATLRQAPASRRLHHAYLGGWLEHLTQVLALSDAVLALHPELNADLLRAGALLLSAGKLREYTWIHDIDLTDAGRLLGQVVLGDEAVSAALAQMPDFPPELALRVRHTLASSRGRYEWGAARPPMTLEAIALHQIDNLNAQISRFRDLLAARREPDQPWTSFDRLLGRQLYAGYEEDSGSADAPED
jgi:3'-5' exoribonuclease